MKKFKNLKGKKFGRLTVLKQDKHFRWLCKCDCGKQKTVRSWFLINNQVKSCGCLLKEIGRKNILKNREDICVVCKKLFKYKGGRIRATCSPKCDKIRTNEYSRKRPKKSFRTFISSLVSGIKRRCIKNNIKYNLSVKYIYSMFIKQHGKCSKTGIIFEISNGEKWSCSPNSPSIDRINFKGGYTKNNIQLICMVYNFCKHTWTDNDVELFAKRLLNYKRRKKNE